VEALIYRHALKDAKHPLTERVRHPSVLQSIATNRCLLIRKGFPLEIVHEPLSCAQTWLKPKPRNAL
jgi:hypothetical protein